MLQQDHVQEDNRACGYVCITFYLSYFCSTIVQIVIQGLSTVAITQYDNIDFFSRIVYSKLLSEKIVENGEEK